MLSLKRNLHTHDSEEEQITGKHLKENYLQIIEGATGKTKKKILPLNIFQ